MSQTSFLPALDPDELIEEAMERFDPLAVVALTSGGKDSTTVAHRCWPYLTHGLAHIDTGIAVPGCRAFVESFAQWLGQPLRILESGDAYRNMVLGLDGKEALGFPSAGQHFRAYQQLKERQLEVLRRELKGGKRGGKVLFITGIRRAESQRRKARMPITEVGSMGFVNPIIDWTDEQCRTYAAEQAIPESEAAALLHSSGECQCGSYSDSYPGEREMLQALWPNWFERTIASLEREARAAGIERCRWGGARPRTFVKLGPDAYDREWLTPEQIAQLEAEAGAIIEPPAPPGEVGLLCSGCQLRFELVDG